ncbi:MAG: hypothetical protein AAGG59_02950 [Bacteroidota bacterium]
MKKKNKILCLGMILSLAALKLSAQNIDAFGTDSEYFWINHGGHHIISELRLGTTSGQHFTIGSGNDTSGFPILRLGRLEGGSPRSIGHIKPNEFVISKALLGVNSSNNLILQHADLSTSGNNYAITQNSSGLTVVNAAAGEEIQFSIGGVGQAKFDNGNFEIIGGNGLTVDSDASLGNLLVKAEGNNVTLRNTNNISANDKLNLLPTGELQVVGADLRISSDHTGLILSNSESDVVENPEEGLVIYDRNFFQNPESGTYDGNTGVYDAGVGYFTTDGGGLQVYHQEDGWNSLIDTKNMDNLNATFNEVSVNDDLHVEDNAVIGNELVIGTTIDELVAGTVLTVDGAVHISPADVAPSPFSVNDYLADYLLWVEKGVVSIDYAISDPQAWDGVPDYVFEEDYKLSSLEKLKSYVKKHKHLPGIPGVDELKEKNHYQVHDMLMGQLKNIEELTLHTIEQEEKINEQEEKIDELERRLDHLEKLITQ